MSFKQTSSQLSSHFTLPHDHTGLFMWEDCGREDWEAEGEGWVDAGSNLPGCKSYFSITLTAPGRVFISLPSTHL